jgi:hypothetical protein
MHKLIYPKFNQKIKNDFRKKKKIYKKNKNINSC